jgi:hypothetical protein
MVRYHKCLIEYKILFITSGILFIICLGLFFGLNYPEIIRYNTFQHEICKIQKLTIKSSYNCQIKSEICVISQIKDPCDLMKNFFQNKDPEKCANDTHQCVKISNECNNGYTCCHTHCSICQSCTTDSKGRKICSFYDCNCYCSFPIYETRGYVICDIYYDVIMLLKYKRNNINYTGIVIFPFENKLSDTKIFIKKYKIDQSIDCWHPPTNMTNIVLDIKYSTWKWVISGIFMGLLALVLLTLLFIWLRKIYYKYLAQELKNFQLFNKHPPMYNSFEETSY